MVAPAIWRTDLASSIVVLERQLQADQGVTIPILADRNILVDFSSGGERHLVLEDGSRRHRLLVRQAVGRTPTYRISADDHVNARLGAVIALHGSPQNSSGTRILHQLTPSAYQRHRFGMLLRILDYLADSGAAGPTVREIASEVVYNRANPSRATEWKTSSERRHTQRLVREARVMMQGGYVKLLQGRGRAKLSITTSMLGQWR